MPGHPEFKDILRVLDIFFDITSLMSCFFVCLNIHTKFDILGCILP